jgi:hypothetical protein
MKVNENEIWNAFLTTKMFNSAKELESTTKHNVFRHTLTWFDAKTSTVRQAIDWTDLDNYDDRKELLLLIKHESEDGESVLQFATGVYLEVEDVPEPIYQFRFCFETKEYKYLPIEGELLGFAFVDDFPLMKMFNENE